MADDIAKRDFSDILKNLNRKFDITDCKWTENKCFEIKFRTQINIKYNDYNTYCDEWVDLFAQATDTIWVHKISNTGPKVKFRKQYQCWTHKDKEVKKEMLFDACRCKGTLDIKVLADSSTAAKKSNKYLRLGLNVVVKINFQHLHSVNTKKSLSFFVHHCEPLPEPPKPQVQPNDKVSHLVAKMVKSAAVTSQRAAERAEEAFKRYCIAGPHIYNAQDEKKRIESDTRKGQESLPQAVSYETVTMQSFNTEEKYELKPPIAQVIVNASDSHPTENIYYVQQVLFDSATQTIREVIPMPGNSVQTFASQQLVQVQLPEGSQISQILNVQQIQSNECLEVGIQNYQSR